MLGLVSTRGVAQVLAKDGRAPKNMDVRVMSPSAALGAAGKTSPQVKSQVQAQALVAKKAIDALKARIPGAVVTISPITGSVEVVRSSGTLTDAAPGQSGFDIVRSFLTANSALYGLSSGDLAQLHFIGESNSPGSGLRMVRVEQMVNGRPVFQSETRVTMDRDGRIVRTVGLMVRDATGSSVALSGLIPAEKALVSAMSSVGIVVDEAKMSREKATGDGTMLELVVRNDEAVAGNVPSQIVYFPVAPGVLVPAWSQVTFTSGSGDWYTLVDARTGALLWRKNIRNNVSAHDARFRVYVQADGVTPADNPAPLSPTNATPGSNTQPPGIAPTIVSMHTAMDPVYSPNGWIDDCPAGVCTANETQTIGNNVHAYLDRVGGAGAGGNNQPDTDATSVLDGNGKPMGNPDSNSRNRDFLGTAPRDFETNFLPPPQAGNPEAGQTATGNGNNGTLAVDQFRRGVVTHLFYVVNWYHDKLAALGFDEAAGNFQQTNFSAAGLGNDRVLAEAQDNTSVDNANFSTPPDGQSGRAQMYRFTGPTIDRDGDLDAEVLMHELTHGTSNRIIGNAAGLNWDVGAGMGEGWSDFYALSLLNNTNADDPNGKYASGGYATYKAFGETTYTDNYLYGIRRFPYSTDNTVNPLTWADVDQVTNNLSGGIAGDPLGFNGGGALEVHSVGEIWCLTLWEVRSRVIAANAGDVPTGNQKMLQLVTDALKMTPISPSFVDARDALFDADCATNACVNEQSIWGGFADRGLGYNAVAPLGISLSMNACSHMGIGESFSVPYLDVNAVTVDDSGGNNNGAIEPGEPIKLTVNLKNPWRSASKGVASATATLTSPTAGLTIYDGSSTYPAIPAQGSASGDTFFFVANGVTCGQSLKFTVTTTSALGTHAVDFVLRVGAATGNASPVTYTRTPAAPIVITASTPTAPANFRGVIDAQTITDDFQIADLNFRIDSITHTFPGDLTAMLRGPNGYGNDFVTFLGGAVSGGGDGDNILNMVIDDQAAPPNDLLLATNAQAPYTDDWIAAFNSPTFALPINFGENDPVGQLSRFNGLSSQGVWNIDVSDQFNGDGGTLNAWSIIITPTSFVCAAFAPTSTVSGTQSVSGTFAPGDTVTYTVTLTNNGSGNQADNPGNEFNEVLPASLTLVSASSTSGAAVATTGTNTVTWNGSLDPLGGTVTITITATINSGTAGQTVSAQGSINYDADSNGTNEASAQTDDPSKPGASDSTTFTVAQSSLSIDDVTIPEGNGGSSSANFTVTLSPSSSQTVTVDFATGNGTATAPFDYTAVNGTLTFAPGQTTRTISVPVNGDTDFESDETFFVNLTNANNATVSDGQGQGTITNDDAAPTPTPAAQTLNLSTRMRTDTGNNVGIGGFTITGAVPKHVIIRAIGPSLTKFGFNAAEVLADPTLEVHGPGAFGIITNNNWRDSQETQIKADGLAPTNDLESAIDATLSPGAYTAIVSGNGSPAGICLFEVYDLDSAATSKLANLSTRAFVGNSNNVVIAGFVLGNNAGNDRVVVRGLGPSLSSFGIANALGDPTLELRNENGVLLLADNDWQDNPAQAAEITAAGLAPSNTKEAAIAATLPPGLYTAILAGLNSSTGVGTVEVYDRGP
jgi:uncharacterized repeat protein (TIGR01451 family)